MTFTRVKERVSVVIPCYNSAPYIEQCLDSIAAQTYKHIEIILINDGSTDDVDQIVQRWRQRELARRFAADGQFVSLTLPYNIGYAGANTTGLFLARGEYIAIQDADDFSSPTRIEKQVSFLKKHPDVGMVGTYIAKFRDSEPDVYLKAGFIVDGHANIANKYLVQNKSGASYGSLLFRSEIFDQVGGLVRKLPGKRSITGHDFLFIFKCLKQGVRIENIPEVHYYYRKHAGQMSNTK
ncbi:glycosyltransferase family 2 protein [Paenibacillus puldeungensis]|uniref:Glycosyltransferase family 2 protein n=1 Tax=Paenibacillus puldeungensis TaxID=696536 RepID=A0ABW3RTF7_9BACL